LLDQMSIESATCRDSPVLLTSKTRLIVAFRNVDVVELPC
jgi:hypothetical protein